MGRMGKAMGSLGKYTGRVLLLVLLYFGVGFSVYYAGATDDFEPRRTSSVLRGMSLAGPMLVAILLDLVLARLCGVKSADFAYYPRPQRLFETLSSRSSRLLLEVGLLLLAGYWLTVEVFIWEARQYPAWVIEPQRLPCSLLLLWGILWLAEALARPQRTTSVAAILFIVTALWFTTGEGLSVLSV
jgi:hypothetical protein